MTKKYSVCFSVDISIDDALCSSVEEQVGRKAIEQEVGHIGSCGTLNIDDHWVDIEGVDDVTVEAL